jgi:predicted O-methyltransferase YrrM
MTIDLLLILLLLAVVALQVRLLQRQGESGKRSAEETRGEADAVFDQFQALLYLRDRLDLRQGMPYSRDWSASPDFLKLIADHVLEAKPRTIVECSSGLSSLVLARCCEINGQGRVCSLENGEDFADRSREQIRRYGLEGRVSVIHAALEQVSLDGSDYQWYSLADLPGSRIDMLVIDGPPGFLQKNSRYPALPLLRDRLADDCVIFMDDAARPDEREIVRLWQERFPEIRVEYVDTRRGCSILRRIP